MNAQSDSLSRVYQYNYKWPIQEKYIRIIFNTGGNPQVDFFATAMSRKAPNVCSLAGRDLDSLRDAFQTAWSGALCVCVLLSPS